MLTLAGLRRVNVRINHDVRYRTDLSLYRQLDHWEPATGEGDCEDYALAKRNALREIGWPDRDLRLATCWDETGAYHAVLTVDFEDATWVLDNRSDRVADWEALERHGYRWDRRQAADGPRWVKITK
ncbi:hypothetical protein CLG96_02150 [Sphingomonas oleivorans]|uniref:Transglutaminase n=1 Tax=Sphingomonas oleivorans TaxID=1735121 RepID=A0A2T5G1D5_9SPHN|nr:transglutaminase-like cysteine peptidase [Sphingomonas oleivorans]PTQ12967.1 hypothetical protein CLG96_02150 [Sphingomonas oleivorans]